MGCPDQDCHHLQMRIMNVIAQSLLVVLVSASASASGAPATNHATFKATLGYPPGSRVPTTSRDFQSPHGQAYRFRLDPQRDVDGNDIVVELVMQGASGSSHGSNLLDATGRLHGMQKWFFAASDLAHGPERSVYGDARTIDLPRLGITVEAKVVRVEVKPTPATAGMPAGYRFSELTLEIRVRRR